MQVLFSSLHRHFSRLLFVAILLSARQLGAQPKEGVWRGELLLQQKDGIVLPFNFEVVYDGALSVVIRNGQERIAVKETRLENDSFFFYMPVFDTEFRTKQHGDTMLSGYWINHTKKENNRIPFSANFGQKQRFLVFPGKFNNFYEGKWEVTFSPGTADSSKAIGQFHYRSFSNTVEGTFRTETGDYRYLEGVEYGGKLYLSCFDGSHAFLFTANQSAKGIKDGIFYSGNSWSEPWTARRNESFELRDPEKLTYLKDPNQVIGFSFKNSSEQTVSLSDAAYRNKVVIVQIMGSWCPNCMDETAYLSTLYNRFQGKGLEVIGLAYERTSDPEKARNNIRRLKARFGVNYEILVTGLSGKDQASTSLPFLNGIMAFPTTLILNKDHRVVSVYTGFNGPATGKAYEEYVQKTERLLKSLLK